jgi:hypothetical protein
MVPSFPAGRAVRMSAAFRGARGRLSGASLVGGLAAVVFSAPMAAAVETMTLLNDADRGIKLEVEGWAGISNSVDGRDAGLLPLTFVVSNDGATDQLWSIGPGRGYGRSTGVVPMASLRVPAKGSARATVYVDINASGHGQYTQLAVAGPGYTRDFTITGVGSSTSGGSTVPLPSAISQGVSNARGDAFNAYAITGAGLDMGRPPEDWRGWSSLTALLMTDGEWLALPGASRTAVLEWTALGGRLGVLVADTADDRLDRLRFPSAGPDGRRRVGAGELVPIAWNGKTLTAKGVQDFLNGRTAGRRSSMLQAYREKSAGVGAFVPTATALANGGWQGGFGQLYAVFGPRSLPVVPILGFLAVFGLVAGPLNLMLLAGPGRRSRMFWTTPAISLVATLFLLALMFFRDGIGGAGVRRVLALLVPEQHSMAVVQEQFSRTGVLLGGSFAIREPSWMRPLGDPTRDGAEFEEVEGRVRRGDWFRSRSDQAFLLEAVRPSRARIEFVPPRDGTPPAVLSSIDVPLEQVFVIDAAGTFWTASDVGTGEKKRLEPSTAEAFGRWFDARNGDAGPVRRAALDSVRSLRGWVYAGASQAGTIAVQTHPSIGWRDEQVTFAGPYVETPAP